MTATPTVPGTSDHAQVAVEGADRVEGPLKGNHHRTFAVRVDAASALAREFRWLKLREPRDGVLWYDMRWFPSEDVVLRLLRDQLGERMCRVPQVCERRVQDGPPPVVLTLVQFIEGATLDRVHGGRAGRVAERFVRQIEELFAALASVDAGRLVDHGGPAVTGCADCDLAAYPENGGTTRFFERLKHFTFTHAYDLPHDGAGTYPPRGDAVAGPPHSAGYRLRREDLDELLADLGVPADRLAAFAAHRPRLTDRPRALLHGDLHRKNFVVDRAGTLWTIDWELALIGDPLYDLATHLHLMDYPADQEADVIARWARAVGAEASCGAHDDLPQYRAFKRVQSLCTDVLRAAARLTEAHPADEEGEAAARTAARADGRPIPARGKLRAAAVVVGRALEAARPHLALDKTAPLPAIELALHDVVRRSGRA